MDHSTDATRVNINGKIHSRHDAKVSVFDRSYLYGDSLYEVARSYKGRLFLLEEHLERLSASARLARMPLSQPLEEYATEMQNTVDNARAAPGQADKDYYCRIIISRGSGPIGFALEGVETPTQYVIVAEPIDRFLPKDFERGSNLHLARRYRNDRGALDPAMKSGNYLNSLLAYLEAREAGCEDALLCTKEGFVTEGTTYNVFYVRRGIVVTSPLEEGILEGLTRRHVLRIAEELGFETRVVPFPKERLLEADEIFSTSTLKEIWPVTRLDGEKVGTGKPGTITRELARAFTQWAVEECTR